MLCYAMLCYAMLCYAMLCYAMLCYAMLCYAMLNRNKLECLSLLVALTPKAKAERLRPQLGLGLRLTTNLLVWIFNEKEKKSYKMDTRRYYYLAFLFFVTDNDTTTTLLIALLLMTIFITLNTGACTKNILKIFVIS
jgi:hypothetical protein